MGIEDTIKQERFKNQTGSYARFTDIDGIGPATAEKIKSVRLKRGSVQAPKDVADMSADELSDKAGISRDRARKAIKGGGGNPNVSKVNDNTGSVSAAGIKTKQGDFMVGFGDLDRARARNDPRTRSEEAVRMDEQKRAPVTTDYEKWKSSPGRWDFPGVDTPTQNPKALPKDYKAGDPRTTDVSDEEVATGGNQGPDLMREIGGEQFYSEEVVDEGPSGAIPGLAPEDFEREPESMAPTTNTSLQNMFAKGESADLAFTKAERQRKQDTEEQSQQSIPKQSRAFGEELMETREERGNLAANLKYWEKTVREFEEEDMSVEFDEVTNIAGQTVVELGDFFEGDDGGVDAVVTGLAERGAPVKGVEGTERVRIDASDEPRPIPFREREKSITGRFAEEL